MKIWIGRFVNVLIAGVIATGGAVPVASASSEATVPQNTYSVAKIEVNIFGNGPVRCAVLFWAYYEGKMQVIDWRWCEQVGIKLGVSWDGRYVLSGNVPRLDNGRYYLMWDDGGVFTIVAADGRIYIVSPEDREIAQREFLPAEKRPKLYGTGYSASATPLVFPTPTPTPELANPMVAP